MIVILLGILDILAGLSILTLKFTWSTPVIWFFILYLITKSLPSLKSVASVIDIIVAGVFVFAILGYVSMLVNAMCAIWLIQKGIISFF